MPRPRGYTSNNTNTYSGYSTNTYNNWGNNKEEKRENSPPDGSKQVDIYVSTSTYKVKLIEDCIQGEKSPPKLAELIFDFEEDELVNLAQDLSYQGYGSSIDNPLYSLLKEIARELNVNIQVFIGHIDTCQEEFLTPIEERLDTITEPTIILLIACLGAAQAQEANQTEIWQKSPVVVMGFQDLVHIYKNEIYSCKLPHISVPNMSCSYDSAKENYKSLVNNYSSYGEASLNEYNLARAKYNSTNKLVGCCTAKIDRFRSIFLENLRKRQCVKYKKEKLLEKIKGILKEDGTFDRSILENPSSYIFSSADGISCDDPEGECKIENPYKNSLNLAKSFNQSSALFLLYEKFNTLANQSKSRKEKDSEILKLLQGLRQTELDILRYRGENGLLLHILAFAGCVESILYILKRHIELPLHELNQYNHTFMEELLISKGTPEEEYLRVLIKVLELEPGYFDMDDVSHQGVLYFAVRYQKLSIVQYLAEHTTIDFSKQVFPQLYNYNLLFISYQLIPWTTERAYKLVKLLLAKGVDPKHVADENYDIIRDYFKINPPLVKEKIMKELCYYGYSNKKELERGIEFFSRLLTIPVEQIRYSQIILDEVKWWEDNWEGISEEIIKEFEEYKDVRELFIENFKLSIQNTIRTLEECKKIIIRGGKKNTQIATNKAKTLRNTKQNVLNTTRRILAPDKIAIAYQDIDEYIKKVGVKFSKNEKKIYRERGISILRNKSKDVLERLQMLEDILKEIIEESVKRGERVGGRRKTKKFKNKR